MRKLRAIFVLALITILILLLDRPIGGLPALGRLLDPVNGAMANAEPVQKNFNIQFSLPTQQPVKVWLDDRLVPHIRAENDHDLYLVQGFIHAYFRLWQMDLQTRAAGGRVSEILGKKALEYDRKQRRKGMGYGAENSLRAMEADPKTKQMLDAYTAGVNSFISTLSYRTYPLEYKVMGFEPESWTNLRTALLLKHMADDLTGYTEDIPLTVLRDKLSKEDFDYLFPERTEGSTPVIPAGTAFNTTSFREQPVPSDLAQVHLEAADFETEEHEGKGSNSWALSGSRTKSGAAIFCNDPHLGLNLPSLWFEIQLQAPGMNVYGVSLPGAPGVIIGFNDSISWGFTNNYRDVKDFYAITPAGNGNSYLFEGKELPFTYRYERIKIKTAPDFVDTVRYTIHGPVMYEEKFHGPGGLKKPLALCWMAHRPTNELLSVFLLNRSKTYADFVAAIQHFQCPAQNIGYADRQGNIAMWGQGQFVNKWKGQGRYVMDGSDSSTLWQELIPMPENPHVVNPAQGFVSSANQEVTDTTYPYWYNGYFSEFRAWRINNVLRRLSGADVQDMFSMQNDVFSYLAANVLPVMLQHLDASYLNGKHHGYLDHFAGWDYRLSPESRAAAVFQVWWAYLYKNLWSERFADIPDNLWPSQERTMQLLQSDTAIRDKARLVTLSFMDAADSLNKVKRKGPLWYEVKNTSVKHLTKLPAFSYDELKIGGWGNTPNAAKHDHGPSWRMVVKLGKEIEAYGVYPGGQSGNPGSRYYANFLDEWVKGKYYKLLFLPNAAAQQDKNIKYHWTIQSQ